MRLRGRRSTGQSPAMGVIGRPGKSARKGPKQAFYLTLAIFFRAEVWLSHSQQGEAP